MVNIKSEIEHLWRESEPLTATAILMMVAFVFSIAGIFLDDRMITGVPAWLKPSKFAISTAIYSATLACLFRYLTVWPRFVRAMGWVVSIVLVAEVAIIDAQAARGTTSHFNVSTPLDSALFGIMGTSIVVLWLASIGVLVALFRQKFRDTDWGWSLRLGMLITVLGSAVGGTMTRMMPEQRETIRVTHKITRVGAHTIGAPDGGPGLPGLGWSTEHGDMRVAHFFGLHGVQIVPLLSLLWGRRRVFGVAASYLGLIAILTWQGLRGQPLIRPDGLTLAALAIWLTASGIALVRIAPHAEVARSY